MLNYVNAFLKVKNNADGEAYLLSLRVKWLIILYLILDSDILTFILKQSPSVWIHAATIGSEEKDWDFIGLSLNLFIHANAIRGRTILNNPYRLFPLLSTYQSFKLDFINMLILKMKVLWLTGGW